MDDDQAFYAMIAEFLRSKGHTVFYAQDPVQFGAMLEAKRPDVLILDMQTPGGGGPKAQKTLDAMKGFEKTPVVFCSGMPTFQLKRWFPEAPHRRYVNKPVDFMLLNEHVNELAGKKPA